jgi:pyruvate dehydrogenase E2 component (dihydrolipoyllysine-residue acetyltransferase)
MPIEIRMPRLVDSMTQGTVLVWRKQEGDPVRAGEAIAEIEVDKATVDLESPGDGTLAKIIVTAGTEKVEVGRVLAVLREEPQPTILRTGEQATVSSRVSEKDNGHPVGSEPAAALPSPIADTSTGTLATGEVNASPLALSMARQAGIDLSSVKGSGTEGRVTVDDLSKALGFQPARDMTAFPRPSGHAASTLPLSRTDYVEVPHSRVRQVIAERLGESKRSIPHFYLESHCRVDALLRVRAEIAVRREVGTKLSINDFAVRAAALALRTVPEANASWTDGATRRYNRVDLAVAVATEAGLVAPVVRDADRKGLIELSAELRDLAQRAREGGLRLEDLQGGTFTLSNLGMYGVDAIYAIINPPQAGILGLGAAEPRPVAQDGSVVVATVMTCTLSADHRVLDGTIGARFLGAFKGFIEQPMTMVL